VGRSGAQSQGPTIRRRSSSHDQCNHGDRADLRALELRARTNERRRLLQHVTLRRPPPNGGGDADPALAKRARKSSKRSQSGARPSWPVLFLPLLSSNGQISWLAPSVSLLVRTRAIRFDVAARRDQPIHLRSAASSSGDEDWASAPCTRTVESSSLPRSPRRRWVFRFRPLRSQPPPACSPAASQALRHTRTGGCHRELGTRPLREDQSFSFAWNGKKVHSTTTNGRSVVDRCPSWTVPTPPIAILRGAWRSSENPMPVPGWPFFNSRCARVCSRWAVGKPTTPPRGPPGAMSRWGG